MFHHISQHLNQSTHSVSGMIASIMSAIVTRLVVTGKAAMIMISTHIYTRAIDPVQVDYKPVIFSEGIVTCFTIFGAVVGYLIIFIIKGILADPESWLAIKFAIIVEKFKFKKKNKTKDENVELS